MSLQPLTFEIGSPQIVHNFNIAFQSCRNIFSKKKLNSVQKGQADDPVI